MIPPLFTQYQLVFITLGIALYIAISLMALVAAWMFQGTTPRDKQPYLKCLIHESKKAAKVWFSGLCIIAVIIGLCWWVWYVRDYITGFFNSIGNAVSSVPWWYYAIAGLIAAPVVYAAVKCLYIRSKRVTTGISGVIIFIYGIVTASYLCILNPPVEAVTAIQFITSLFAIIAGIALGTGALIGMWD